MEFAKTDRINCLYDIYQALLTDHQKEIVTSYYQDDLSLGEIAENFKISRNAVFTLLRRVENLLEDYESKLHLYSKQLRLESILKRDDISSEVKALIESIVEE